MSSTMRSAMLRFIRNMLVELRMSLDLSMTMGTIMLPMTPTPRTMKHTTMHVVRMYPGKDRSSSRNCMTAAVSLDDGAPAPAVSLAPAVSGELSLPNATTSSAEIMCGRGRGTGAGSGGRPVGAAGRRADH